MLIITTIYIAKPQDLNQENAHDGAWAEAADMREAAREWVSIYEGKNRVLPIDSE